MHINPHSGKLPVNNPSNEFIFRRSFIFEAYEKNCVHCGDNDSVSLLLFAKFIVFIQKDSIDYEAVSNASAVINKKGRTQNDDGFVELLSAKQGWAKRLFLFVHNSYHGALCCGGT